jgi:ABC-type uncharacterized transport system ATPase subunit
MRRVRATLNEHVSEMQIKGAEDIKVEGDIWTVLFKPNQIAAHDLVAELAYKLPLKDIVIEEQDIDEIIATMYREMCL